MEESVKSKRQIKRVVILLAVVEFIVTVFAMFSVVKK